MQDQQAGPACTLETSTAAYMRMLPCMHRGAQRACTTLVQDLRTYCIRVVGAVADALLQHDVVQPPMRSALRVDHDLQGRP